MRCVAHHKAGTLHTRPVVIMRHAKANRGLTGLPPTTSVRSREPVNARRLRIAAFWRHTPPTRLLSSPWLRCMQTVAPYANDHAIAIKEKKSLSETARQGILKRTAKVTESAVREGSSFAAVHAPPVFRWF